MHRVDLRTYRGARTQKDVAREFQLTQAAISQAEKKGRQLYVEIDYEAGIKRLIEVRVIKQIPLW